MKSEELIVRASKVLNRNTKFENIFKTVEDLLAVIEQQQQEYITLSQSIAEDDAIIQQLQIDQEQLIEQNKLFRKRIIELRRKTGYQVYEENLSLALEVKRLKVIESDYKAIMSD